MKNRLEIIIFLLLMYTTTCYSQTAWIEKRVCDNDKWAINKGYSLDVFFAKGNDTIKSHAYLDTNPFVNLPDSEKLVIIKQLLTLENDTTLYCFKAGKYWGGEYECNGGFYSPINVPIQIDALYRINGIAFPNICWIYSCAPVLYDTLNRIIINDKPKLVEEVYTVYKEWFIECQRKGKIGNYFPFNEGRYVWYRGKRKSYYPKGE